MCAICPPVAVGRLACARRAAAAASVGLGRVRAEPCDRRVALCALAALADGVALLRLAGCADAGGGGGVEEEEEDGEEEEERGLWTHFF